MWNVTSWFCVDRRLSTTCLYLSEALAEFSSTMLNSALAQRLPSTLLMILLEEAVARGKSRIHNHESCVRGQINHLDQLADQATTKLVTLDSEF